mmetsp:Transcript_4923/g.4107  ORF Transcript_4923/g.4107 Transcript_4923/m.4107 type:complete len:101 (-) Transcript_4923:848-1150(-)
MSGIPTSQNDLYCGGGCDGHDGDLCCLYYGDHGDLRLRGDHHDGGLCCGGDGLYFRDGHFCDGVGFCCCIGCGSCCSRRDFVGVGAVAFASLDAVAYAQR